MAIPTLLRAVDSQMNVNSFLVAPLVLNFLDVYKIIHGTGTVNNINITVLITIVTTVVDYRMKRSQSDTTCDKQQILAL